ncbi:MAG: hypothetical protein K2X34_02690 [Hyphomonadaceae bacterium]|nr:hypothetical protein [Hyphomonadaceae bacterium]MBY0565252.1 hypothetical protein [Hyphomonadaceae bacterium]
MTRDSFDAPETEGKGASKRLKLPAIALGLGLGCVATGLAYLLWPDQTAVWTVEAPPAQTLADQLRENPSAADSASGASSASIPPSRSGYGPVGIVSPYQGIVAQTSTVATRDEECPQVEAVYATIAQTTQGADINDIVAALAQLAGEPQGAIAPDSVLVQRLRDVLGLSGSATPCGTTLAGVGEALRLARLAAADADVATAQIAEAAPPVGFGDIPTGGGAEGSGYKNN